MTQSTKTHIIESINKVHLSSLVERDDDFTLVFSVIIPNIVFKELFRLQSYFLTNNITYYVSVQASGNVGITFYELD